MALLSPDFCPELERGMPTNTLTGVLSGKTIESKPSLTTNGSEPVVVSETPKHESPGEVREVEVLGIPIDEPTLKTRNFCCNIS